MNFLEITLIILSIAGISISGFIILKRSKKQPLVCPINQDCNKVVNSKWSKIFFVKNDIIGILYYLFILILSIIVILNENPIPTISKIISGIALIFSTFLAFVQIKILKNYCFYCLLSSAINLLIFINILII